MPLPLIPIAATAARLAVPTLLRAGAGVARAGAGIAGRLATSFGGALLRGGAALLSGSGASAQQQGNEPESQGEYEQQAPAAVTAEEVEATPTSNVSVGPSTGGDIGGALRGSSLSVLKEIEQNTKFTAQAIAGMKGGAGGPPAGPPSFFRQNQTDIVGGGASLGLALVPLLVSAFQPVVEWITTTYERISQFVGNIVDTVTNAVNTVTTGIRNFASAALEGFNNAFNSITSTIGNALRGIRDFVSSLIPSAAGPGAQPGGEDAEERRQAMLQTQVRATNEFNRIMSGTAIPANVRDEIQEQFLSGRVTTTAQARNLVMSYIRPNTPDFDAAMQAFESINQQRQRDAAYGAGEAGTLEFPEPPPQPRTADSRISPISREDRTAIDETARAMNINPRTITGGIFSPTGELDALIERGGGRREVPAEIRNRARQADLAAQVTQANAAAQPDEFSNPEAINQISTGIETESEAALRAIDRLRPPQAQPQQEAVPVMAPAMSPAQSQTPTGIASSSAAPSPGSVPASPPPAHPGLVNEPASPAASR